MTFVRSDVSLILFTNTTYLLVENTFTILIDKACRWDFTKKDGWFRFPYLWKDYQQRQRHQLSSLHLHAQQNTRPGMCITPPPLLINGRATAVPGRNPGSTTISANSTRQFQSTINRAVVSAPVTRQKRRSKFIISLKLLLFDPQTLGTIHSHTER
jgi:hypothetical protein